MDDLYDWLRIYVVTVSVLVAVVGTLQWRRWLGFKVENRLAWLAIVALNFSMGFGTFETIRLGITGGVRTYVAALAMTFLAAAVFYHPVTALLERRQVRHKEIP